MSLGLPDFGSRGGEASGRGIWRGLQIAGLLVLAYALILTLIEWRSTYVADQSLERARMEVAQAGRTAEEARRSLQKNSDLLIAAASIESSPERVLSDLNDLLPAGVVVAALKIDYLPDATARLDLSVVARTPVSYDLFLNSLSRSTRFSDIKPGAESRPGLVRATVTATHRPKAVSQ